MSHLNKFDPSTSSIFVYMKTIAFMLSILIGVMAMLPCTDLITCKDEVQSLSHNHDHDNHEDTCTPFCICQCCGISINISDLPDFELTIDEHHFDYNFSYSFLYQFDHSRNIWHPPATV